MTGRIVLAAALAVGLAACERPTVDPEVDSADYRTEASASSSEDLVKVGVLFHGDKGPITSAGEALLAEVGAVIEYRFKYIPAVTTRVPRAALEEAVARLKADPLVASAGVPIRVYPLGDVKGWEKLPPLRGHDFDAISGVTGSGARTVVAGTGIQCSNEDLDCAGGETFADDGAPWWMDGRLPDGHETGVASIITAQINSKGRYGWARNASLWSGRIFTDSITADCFDSAEMIDWAIDIGARVVNMSYGAAYTEEYEDVCAAEGVVAQRANITYGILLVAASGNISQFQEMGATYPDSVAYPARWPEVMAVGEQAIATLTLKGSTPSHRTRQGIIKDIGASSSLRTSKDLCLSVSTDKGISRAGIAPGLGGALRQ